MKPSRAPAVVGALGVCGLGAALAAIALLASRQRPIDLFYEQMADRKILPGCAEIHCFRVLVPWAVGLVPLPSFFKWKAYAVMCNAAAAISVSELSLALGLSSSAALVALTMSAFGFGSLYTLFDPFTSDPLMFWLAPAVTRWLLEDRMRRAALVTCVSVFAKEFVVIVVAMFAVWAALWQRQWRTAAIAVATAAAATLVWATLHLALMRVFGYSYGPNRSADLLSGSYLAIWLSGLPSSTALAVLFGEFGALYVLIPFGWFSAPRVLRQLSLAALPFAAFLAYVEQPDRALWNFHFLASPLAAIVLQDARPLVRWAFVAVYAIVNLRIGAQIPFVPPARFTVPLSVALALIVVASHLRRPRPDVSACAC